MAVHALHVYNLRAFPVAGSCRGDVGLVEALGKGAKYSRCFRCGDLMEGNYNCCGSYGLCVRRTGEQRRASTIVSFKLACPIDLLIASVSTKLQHPTWIFTDVNSTRSKDAALSEDHRMAVADTCRNIPW